jgi:hypothetical protein
MNALNFRSPTRAWPLLGALLFFGAAAAAQAQEAGDPPGRVAYVSQRQGSVVFAPQGEEEWTDLPANRPLVEGDRLWTDQGARAELQLGTATVHIDSQTHLGISNLDERAVQFMIQQGTLNVRVREVTQGENVEVDTPNVAFRAQQPGDFRIDVDPQSRQTRIVVHSGMATIFGEDGQAINLGGGQEAAFAGRALAQVNAPAFRQDEFSQWAAERNRQEDQAIASRYVPRGVVGAPELDPYGNWSQDPTYGPVWYPSVTVSNWAPYRYGHWAWIAPWGWTWIDDAPWGFAPFHYGRWTMIGTRWAWVPGHMAPRPVYAPALVVFLGGGAGQFSLGAGPAVGWYPLAPGEAWWPWYHASPRYVNTANWHLNLNAWPRGATNHQWRQRPFAVTTVREEDFRRGRPVERSWQPVQQQMIDRAQMNVVPTRPPRGGPREGGGGLPPPRARNAPPAMEMQTTASPRAWTQNEVPPAVREQADAQREQDRLQRQADRDARQQIRSAEEARRDPNPRFYPPPGWRSDPTGQQQQQQGGDRPRPGDAPRMIRQSQPPAAPAVRPPQAVPFVQVPRQQAVQVARAQPAPREARHSPQQTQHAQAQAQRQGGEEGRGRWVR